MGQTSVSTFKKHPDYIMVLCVSNEKLLQKLDNFQGQTIYKILIEKLILTYNNGAREEEEGKDCK